MVNISVRFAFCIVMALALGATAFAQGRRVVSAAGDKYIISATAGGVNIVEGTVNVSRNQGHSGILLKGDQIEVGDKVSTGADGKVEILMNPGSYVRLGANSVFEFGSTSLDDLQIKLDSGSAMFEVFATNEFKVGVQLPKGSVALVDTGIYRIDVQPNGVANVLVWDGRADLSGTKIKKGRFAAVGGGSPLIARFDRDDREDELVRWSKVRGKSLAKASATLKNSQVRDSLINSFNGGRWGIHDAFGLWVYNTQLGAHCFLPFGQGWYSPYGYWFGNNIWWYNLPTVIYITPIRTEDVYGTKGRSRDSDVRGSGGSGNVLPPFVRVQEGVKMNPPIENTPFNVDTNDRSPVYYPPTRQPAAAPAVNGSKVRDN